MKIVFLNHSISGGGAEKVTMLLSGKMVERGYEVTLMTNLFKPFAYDFDERVDRRPLFRNKKEWSSHFSLFYMIRNVRKMLKDERPDVIIGVLPLMNLVAVIAAIGTGVKVIVSDHTSFDRPLNPHIRFIRSFVYRFADAVTVLTQVDYDFLGKRLPRKVVMPNPLAYPCVEMLDGPRRKNILAVGRLDVWKVKGFDLLIEAWAQIADRYPEWILEIAGDGTEKSKNELQEIAKNNHVENRIRFLGFRKDIDTVMRESSIFVLSSRIEGFGMVLIEAMSQGCACISFDDGGRQSEIIRSDEEGIIIKEHNTQELAKKIEFLIKNISRRVEIASNGVNRACQYDLRPISNKWISLIEKITSNQ